MGNHLTAGRDIYVTFLEQAGRLASLDFSEAINRFQAGIAVMGKIAEAIQLDHLDGAAAGFAEIAKEDKAAFTYLLNCVGEGD
ncbi:MAG: hypothetical protein A2029_07040 [Chloroflexi bacterium RBG_19FT_COMBO_47_9]|nr:MAG: hypothetical protein A2029_07040 [Chloroflexi bacterium RBG_19FT_COMBO_47_9]